MMNGTLDIWSFGCLIFELLTGRLFNVMWDESEALMNDSHLLELSTLLGELPDELLRHWKMSSRYFTSDRKLFNYWLESCCVDSELL